MMMPHLELLRERIADAPTNRRGYRRYARELRRDIENHTASRVAEGASYQAIAAELGLAAATLLNWCKDSSSKPPPVGRPMGFRPVEVRAATNRNSVSSSSKMSKDGEFQAVSRPVVVLPSGVRIEGLTLSEVPDFLKRLECR